MRLRLAREDAANDCGVSCADEDAKAKDSTPAFCCSGCCVRAMCGVVRPWSEDARHEQKVGDGLSARAFQVASEPAAMLHGASVARGVCTCEKLVSS